VYSLLPFLFSVPTEALAKGYVAIVDPYSSGSYLCPEFRSRGYECIHVQSQETIPAALRPSYRESDFFRTFVFKGDLELLVKELSEFNVVAVVAGSELGVLLADQLSDALKLSTSNGTALSYARRDKYEMAETIRRKGVRAVKQMKSSDWASVVDWAKAHNQWPVVVKPINSAATDGVTLCSNFVELEAAFHSILGKTNILGIKNDAVLVQEYLKGPEFVVDAVSLNGKHHVTDIWKYEKAPANDSAFVYYSVEILPHSGPEQDLLIPYAMSIMDALDIKNGPAHCEIIMTSSGPVLVEVGSRLHGGDGPVISAASVGYGQIDMTADAYLDPAAFEKKASQPYSLKKYAKVAFMISRQEGTVVKVKDSFQELENLPSKHAIHVKAKAGSVLKLTRDLFSSPGWVTLMHENPKILSEDYLRLRKLDLEGFFEVENHR
jgi:biotin carboxylase